MTAMLIILGTCLFLGILCFLPAILGAIIDPRNIKIIQADCASKGYTDVTVKLWPNHYGVSYTHNGKKQYAACKVQKGVVKWKQKNER